MPKTNDRRRLQGGGFWFLILLHMPLLPMALQYKYGYFFPIYVVICQGFGIFYREKTTDWVMRRDGNLISDPEIIKYQELPWYPIYILQFGFGVVFVVKALTDGNLNGVAEFFAIISLICMLFTGIRAYFKHSRF